MNLAGSKSTSPLLIIYTGHVTSPSQATLKYAVPSHMTMPQMSQVLKEYAVVEATDCIKVLNSCCP